MTRDAEHTPTGYEDAASVVVNQAPAPSSLAGGEERFYRRAAKIIRELGPSMSPGALAATCERRADKEAAAALSPEAPARVVGTIAHVSHGRSELSAQITAALTPRHEAPAPEGDA